MIIKTSRLLLRKMCQNDFEELSKILQDTLTMHAYEHAFSDEEVQVWLDKQLVHYETHGFGLWAVELLSSGKMIGQCGLTYQQCDDKEVLEIGYLFQRCYWGRGYAIESAKACKQYAFDTLDAKEIYSIIRDNNIASMNVAIRNGMTIRSKFIKHYFGIDMPHYAFSIKKTKCLEES